MIWYTLSFIFDEQRRVALIRKNRPASLAGRWNGIGGKVESTDLDLSWSDKRPDHYAAAARELYEEADLNVLPSELKLVAIYSTNDYEIRVTTAVKSLARAKTMTDEEVKVIHYTHLFEQGDGLLLDPHALLFLQASYIAAFSPNNFLALITDKLS